MLNDIKIEIVNKTIELNKERYLTFPPKKEGIKKYFNYNLFLQSFPPLFIALIAQLICGNLLNELLENNISIKFPVVVIINSILIFMGNLEITFDINILSAKNLIECRSNDSSISLNSSIKNIDDENTNNFINHIKKSSLYLLFNSFIVSLITTAIACFYKMIFSKTHTSLKLMLLMALCIIPTCMLSMLITIISVLGTIMICKRFNFNPDNIAIPFVSSINEVVTVVIIRSFLLNSIQWNNLEILLFSFLYIFIIILILIILRFINKKTLEEDISIATPHLSTYIITFLGITISTSMTEKMSETYPIIATISLIYCGIILNIIMIYTSRICTTITQNFEKSKIFKRKTIKILKSFNLKLDDPRILIPKLSDLQIFYFLLKKCYLYEISSIFTLNFSCILLSSLYLIFSEIHDSYFLFYLILLFSISSVLGMLLIPLLLKFEYWLNSHNNDLMNGRLGSNTLIFSTILIEVFGTIFLCILFLIYADKTNIFIV